MIRAVTFDFWQTLYQDSGPIEQHRVMARADLITQRLRSRGMNFSIDTLLSALGLARLELDRVWKQERRTIDPKTLAGEVMFHLGLEADNGLIEDVAIAIQTAALDVPADRIPYAFETLMSIAQRYRVALICDTGFTPGRILREMMRRDGVIDCFSHLTFSDEIGSSKPSTRNFELTLQALDVQPGEALHIGDLIETDIIGAKSAGMNAVLYWGEGREYDSTHPADAVIRDLRALPELINSLGNGGGSS